MQIKFHSSAISHNPKICRIFTCYMWFGERELRGECRKRERKRASHRSRRFRGPRVLVLVAITFALTALPAEVSSSVSTFPFRLRDKGKGVRLRGLLCSPCYLHVEEPTRYQSQAAGSRSMYTGMCQRSRTGLMNGEGCGFVERT